MSSNDDELDDEMKVLLSRSNNDELDDEMTAFCRLVQTQCIHNTQ